MKTAAAAAVRQKSPFGPAETAKPGEAQSESVEAGAAQPDSESDLSVNGANTGKAERRRRGESEDNWMDFRGCNNVDCLELAPRTSGEGLVRSRRCSSNKLTWGGPAAHSELPSPLEQGAWVVDQWQLVTKCGE